MPIAKRRHFGRFCLALVFNFPSFLYQPASPGTLVLYRVRFVGLRSGYLIPGATCYHTGFRVTCPVHFFVGSMAEIDTVASRIGGSPVQFVDHLALTRIVQPWAGHQLWRPCRKAIKTSIFRGRHREGELRRDKRMTAKDHRVVSRGADLIEWTELRRFRAISPQVTQTIYRLNHVFWNCPAAQVHWRRLLDLWRCFGEFEDANIHVWVFAFWLPACPREAWAAAKTWLTANESNGVAQASFFAAANVLWRFVVASTTHSIWVERLCQMQNPTLLPEEHQARAVSSLRSTLARFRCSTDTPNADDAERAQARVRAALTDLFCTESCLRLCGVYFQIGLPAFFI
uniref:RxLR effector candidate protein n=1 Tax=Hyaloperonospora arabidopsidis (strain Emoy2) TaxID=559515 RepID=M4BRA5_HYAAE